ncbi:MAG: helix-turn-helix transcriptional regulator [Phycisphaera sp.]|nr:helix-turn-helix transcriptional regulator [Phycisphaera sp.]
MSEDDDFDRLRAERNQRFARQLDRQQVWSLDDPAVREILFEPLAMRLLDAIRRSLDPVKHAALFDAELGSPLDVTTRLQRLESIGMIRFDRTEGESGFRSVDRIIAVHCGESEEDKSYFERYRGMVSAFNDSLPEIPVEHEEENLYTDRVHLLTDEERKRVEEAIHRVLRELCRVEESPAVGGPEEPRRTPMRLSIRKSEIAVDGPLLAPVFLFRENMIASSRKILDSLVDRLTPRQLEVATLLVEGATKSDIAETLDVSENTIKSTVRAIYKKLGVTSKAEFIRSMTR